MVAYICNPTVQEAETGGLLLARYPPRLHNEFKNSLNYTAKYMLHKTKVKPDQTKTKLYGEYDIV